MSRPNAAGRPGFAEPALQTVELPASEAIAAAAAAGLHVHLVDARRPMGKPEVLAALAAALRFPAWSGANWDALADSLGDLSWLPAGGHALVIDAGPGELGPAWSTALEILAEAVAEQAPRARPLHVVVVAVAAGAGGEAAGPNPR
ncbi:MAG: barstar family protein [Acidimicrobiales bacterium]